jgi:hypothetical protein
MMALWANYPVSVDAAALERDLERYRISLQRYRDRLASGGGSAGSSLSLARYARDIAIGEFGLGGSTEAALLLLRDAAEVLRTWLVPDPNVDLDFRPLTVASLAGDVELLHALGEPDRTERFQSFASWSNEAGRAGGDAWHALASGDRSRAEAAVTAYRVACDARMDDPVVVRMSSPTCTLFEAALGRTEPGAAQAATAALCRYYMSRLRAEPVVGVVTLWFERGATALSLARLAGLDPVPENCPYLLAPFAVAHEPGAIWRRAEG